MIDIAYSIILCYISTAEATVSNEAWYNNCKGWNGWDVRGSGHEVPWHFLKDWGN